MNWKDGTTICVDVETTGLEAGKDKIVELGAALSYRGELGTSQSWLVNPGIPIPEAASAVHGIHDDDVKGCPSINELAGHFLPAVHSSDVLVAYNWPFDAGFLEAAFADGWRDSVRGKVILDPLVVVRFDAVGRYWRGKGRHRLEAVAKRLGVSAPGDAHRVEADCRMTLMLLDKLKSYLPDDGREATAMIERRRREQDANFKAWLARKNRN